MISFIFDRSVSEPIFSYVGYSLFSQTTSWIFSIRSSVTLVCVTLATNNLPKNFSCGFQKCSGSLLIAFRSPIATEKPAKWKICEEDGMSYFTLFSRSISTGGLKFKTVSLAFFFKLFFLGSSMLDRGHPVLFRISILWISPQQTR